MTGERYVVVYVQLLSPQQLDLDGRSRIYRPGDFVDVGKQLALRWLAEGAARVLAPTQITVAEGDAGILLRHESPRTRQHLEHLHVSTPIRVGPHQPEVLPWDRTLLWDPSAPLKVELLPAGFHFLERWSVVAPLWDYDQLARDLGSPADRARTEAVIHDLRVPVYETRALFVRRCEETAALLAQWAAELTQGGDERLAFQRAVYRVKPLILAVPMTWIQGRDVRGK